MNDPGPSLALTLSAHFKALLENGLERHEALELVKDYQLCLLDNSRDSEETGA
jgi:hypothetical protein